MNPVSFSGQFQLNPMTVLQRTAQMGGDYPRDIELEESDLQGFSPQQKRDDDVLMAVYQAKVGEALIKRKLDGVIEEVLNRTGQDVSSFSVRDHDVMHIQVGNAKKEDKHAIKLADDLLLDFLYKDLRLVNGTNLHQHYLSDDVHKIDIDG